MATRDPQPAGDRFDSEPVAPLATTRSAHHDPPFIFVVLAKNWWIFLLFLVVSGGMAAGVAMRYSRQTAESTGSLLYTGLPMHAGARLYEPPTLATLLAFFDSHDNLSRLIDVNGLDVNPVQLAGRIKVKPSHRSAKIDVTFRWDDPEEAVQLLDGLFEIFIEDVARRRSETIDAYIRHTDRMLMVNGNKVDRAAERLRTNRKNEGDVASRENLLERELESLSSAVESIKTGLESAEFTRMQYQTEVSALKDQLAELTKTYKQKLLTDIHGVYKEALKGYGPKSLKRTQLLQAGQRLKTLAATVDEDQDLTEWKMQMLDIFSTVAPGSGALNADSLAPYEREIEKIESRLGDLRLNLLVNDQGIEMLKARLTIKEADLADKSGQVLTRSDYAQQLEAEWEEANSERQQIRQQKSKLQHLKEYREREFAIATPAYVSAMSSSGKKLFVMTMFFTMLALSAPVFVWELFAGRTITVEQTGRKFGLPVLARGSLAPLFGGHSDVDPSNMDSLRLLALRIQQSISQPGSTVLFSSLDHSESTFPLLCGLARCFSEREERVLILDAGKCVVASNQQLKHLFGDLPQILFADRGWDKIDQGGSTPKNESASNQPSNGSTNGANGQSLEPSSGPIGLSDYLSLAEMDPAEIVLPTRYSGVDCICGGRRPFPVEGLATRRMSDVFDRARKEYGMVLVAGPPSSQLADVQMLAARADGILFTAIPGKPLASRSHDVLQELLDLEAPIIGIVG